MRRTASTTTTAALGLTLVAAAPAHAVTATPQTQPNPRVGALFSSPTALMHGCTASVVSSSSGDLIITAAHCVRGSGSGLTFVPGYDRGKSPYGRWSVTQAYVPSEWKRSQDPQSDVAILRVAKRPINGVNRGVQQVAGSVPLATSRPTVGARVTVPAYPAGAGDPQLSCTAPATAVRTSAGVFPSFACERYLSGVSGAPFYSGGKVTGVIGGWHQGGCSPAVSFSSDFGAGRVGPLLTRAQAGRLPDTNIPAAGSDGC